MIIASLLLGGGLRFRVFLFARSVLCVKCKARVDVPGLEKGCRLSPFGKYDQSSKIELKNIIKKSKQLCQKHNRNGTGLRKI